MKQPREFVKYQSKTGKTFLKHNGKKIALLQEWEQPWGKYSVWFLQETFDTLEEAKASAKEWACNKHAVPDNQEIVEMCGTETR